MGLVKTRRLAAMHPPSRCALRRTGKQQRAIHLRQGYGGLKAGMKPPEGKGACAQPPHLHKSGGKSAVDLPRQKARSKRFCYIALFTRLEAASPGS